MKFFTSGLYFNDESKSSKRHFNDVNKMNNLIVDNWNSVVTDDDMVYILGNVGDFNYLKALNGEKVVILSDYDLIFYKNYVESITSVRNELLDNDLFQTYCKNVFNLQAIIYKKSFNTCINHDVDIRLSVDYENEEYSPLFSIVGNMGQYQRAFKSGINVDMFVNGYFPVSSMEISDIMVNIGDAMFF